MANTTKQITLIKRFAIKPGTKTFSPLKLTDKCSSRKKEKIKAKEINTISQQKIIHRGANFLKKRLDILISLFEGTEMIF